VCGIWWGMGLASSLTYDAGENLAGVNQERQGLGRDWVSSTTREDRVESDRSRSATGENGLSMDDPYHKWNTCARNSQHTR
jgi:hypothetical protein